MTWMLVMLALATWRIAFMLVEEMGPKNIFAKLRHKVGIGVDASGISYPLDPDAFLPSVLTCIYCTSVWVGLFFTLIAAFSVHVAFWIAAPFCLSAAAMLMQIWAEKE